MGKAKPASQNRFLVPRRSAPCQARREHSPLDHHVHLKGVQPATLQAPHKFRSRTVNAALYIQHREHLAGGPRGCGVEQGHAVQCLAAASWRRTPCGYTYLHDIALQLYHQIPSSERPNKPISLGNWDDNGENSCSSRIVYPNRQQPRGYFHDCCAY